MSNRLLVTSTDLMMIQFLVPHIINLSEHGYEIDLACSDVGGRLNEVRNRLDPYVKKIFQVHLQRNPAALSNLQGRAELKKIIDIGMYDAIWTNEPVMGVMTRLAASDARKKGTRVLYMVHGFHFFDGASKVYWTVFYPIEKVMSKYCDMLCTINHEDYERAKQMHCSDVRYIHGIGINTERLKVGTDTDIRKELGLNDHCFLILTVAELNENKNQKSVIEAVRLMNDPSVHYLLCGKGDQLESLKKQTEEAGLQNQIHFLGYRMDVVNICRQVDVFVLPSYREGLPVSMLEAMYCGVPVIGSPIRGINDLIDEGKGGFFVKPGDSCEMARVLTGMKADMQLRQSFGEYNMNKVIPYCIENTKDEVLGIIDALAMEETCGK